MPSLTRSKVAPPIPDRIYRPLDAFADGAGFVAGLATRLRGDHRAVLDHPALWVEVGADDVAMAAIKEERFPAAEPAVDRGDPRVHLPRAVPWQETVVCIESFALRLGGSLLEVRAGDRGARDDPRFAGYRSHFRPAVEADMPAA
jgi:hypothetical protein